VPPAGFVGVVAGKEVLDDTPLGFGLQLVEGEMKQFQLLVKFSGTVIGEIALQKVGACGALGELAYQIEGAPFMGDDRDTLLQRTADGLGGLCHRREAQQHKQDGTCSATVNQGLKKTMSDWSFRCHTTCHGLHFK
jgi:hypothetical protein